MLPARKENIRKHKGRRCKAIILLMASFIFLFVNTPLSFAGFASDGKATFSASVTVASFVDSDYDGIPDEYDLNPNDYEDAVADDDNNIVGNHGVNLRRLR